MSTRTVRVQLLAPCSEALRMVVPAGSSTPKLYQRSLIALAARSSYQIPHWRRHLSIWVEHRDQAEPQRDFPSSLATQKLAKHVESHILV